MKRLLALLMSVSLLFVYAGSDAQACRRDKAPKYIFLFIGDGMGMTHVAVTESYLSYKNGSDAGLTMCSFPYFGFCSNASADADITDSSAAATAIACGEKTNNGFLGVDAEGKPLRSMTYDLKECGYQIGILSNVPVNHATPASFYASSKGRSDYYNISMQIPQTGFEFFAGSGFLNVRGRNKDQEPVDKYLTDKGYTVCYGVEEFESEVDKTDNIIFCQASSKVDDAGNYVSDGKKVEDVALAEMLQLGLDFIDDEKPFFFMCEGGNIDWDAHANKTMPVVADVIEFDDAVAIAYDFYKEHPDETLIIVTADHETGGLTLGAGGYDINWSVLDEQWEQIGHRNVLRSDDNAALNAKASIGWTTSGHTGVFVPVFSIGVNAERFSGKMDNTGFKSKILDK